jgi:oligopeptide transport system permease protein
MARIVRGQVIHLKTQAFVEVARTYGAGNWRIVSRHLVPNVLGPVIVYTTLLIPAIIMFESFLSFLGLGVQAPNASWGTLIKEGADAMTVHPWRLIFPALFFSTTLLALNFLGDGLRDAFDPKGTR